MCADLLRYSGMRVVKRGVLARGSIGFCYGNVCVRATGDYRVRCIHGKLTAGAVRAEALL